METTAIAPAIPLISPHDLSLTKEAWDIAQPDEIDEHLTATLQLLRGWLEGDKLSEYYGLTPHNCKLMVEMCHLLYGLDKTLARCAAETEDKQLQELFIRHAFHSHHMHKYWDFICQKLTHIPITDLEPLTSTQMFQLALENMAVKDPLAFSYALGLFGSPGDIDSLNTMAQFFELLSIHPEVNKQLTLWVAEATSNEISFASIPVTHDYGYPYSGSYGKACTQIMGVHLQRDLEASLINLAALGDQFHLFYRGISIFYVNKALPFPHLKMDWLHGV
ncbi:hypothetical protein [Yersinia aleksiciae]|uniref:Uncharacterized protein n=1 Tax=Yersinia aleksiciae TaxID=263819 RepID=A0ABM5UCZ3_YERAE|nr:hypothetical protein [Yersinia aleksiciae]AKP33503.1 hypothetical protein ACZ76_08120 [Yersinia aleksiciae]CFQ40330.1 Uncharacterised protein [Yersinia aleksiciae]